MSIHGALSSLTEYVPTVITKDLLVNLATSQSSLNRITQYIKQGAMELDEVKEIRIEHCNVLHISQLWILKNLTKLSLCNNIIEKIENLDELVNLKELDLSFNHIEAIENLATLVNIEILSLYSNEIKELKGLDQLGKLQIFSIGRNLLSDWDHVLYLRKFKSLRSLNTSGNPCTEQSGYRFYVIAIIPQLIYFSYKMISEDNRTAALEKYHRDVVSLEEAEAIENKKLQAEKLFQERATVLYNAYLEGMDEDDFFNEMFKNDYEGKMMIDINQDTENAYESYRDIFCEICANFVGFGLSDQEKRIAELQAFHSTVETETTKVADNMRERFKFVFERKDNFFIEAIRSAKNQIDETDDENLKKALQKAEEETEDIITFVKQEWNDLMKNEVTLHQQILDTVDTFKASMTDMVSDFVETARAYFSQLRGAETEYNSNLNKLLIVFLNNFSDDVKMPPHLVDLCGEKDILNNNIRATHDVHLQVIDSREDILISRIKLWFNDLMTDVTEQETRRYKSNLLDIARTLDFNNLEIEKLLGKNYSNVNNVCLRILRLINENELTQFIFDDDKQKRLLY